ncbi:hypothetical protein Q8F57_003385 [Paraburkholderia terrae]|uniref:hypothetical protein n=1 Tax=Paraburkholderia terrae TaxID=311230 RepID=UPI00296B440F|nr:hypothetical protein [Paraburkholderia terrae]MDW3655431.1 hypothetical protein [Paraburkholderia terrae]
MSIEKEQAVTTPKRAARAAMTIFRFTRNVLAVAGVFFVYLLWHGYSAYQAEMASTAADASCIKSSRCM